MPGTSAAAGASNSGISTQSRRASRRSSASRSSCATSPAGRHCRVIGSPSTASQAAARSSSSPSPHPQPSVDKVLKRSCHREPRHACYREPDPRAIGNPHGCFHQADQQLPRQLTQNLTNQILTLLLLGAGARGGYPASTADDRSTLQSLGRCRPIDVRRASRHRAWPGSKAAGPPLDQRRRCTNNGPSGLLNKPFGCEFRGDRGMIG